MRTGALTRSAAFTRAVTGTAAGWLAGLLLAVTIVAGACATATTAPTTAAPSGVQAGPVPPRVVTVTSQRCARPMVHRGVALDLGDGGFLTAAHVVNGRLRTLELDGRPAEVVGLDTRLDLAVLTTSGDVPGADRVTVPLAFATSVEPGPATIVTDRGDRPVQITREITLRVTDVSRQTVHTRPVLELDRAVERGVSGSPVLDGDGLVVGIVLHSGTGARAYAVRTPPGTADLRPAAMEYGCP